MGLVEEEVNCTPSQHLVLAWSEHLLFSTTAAPATTAVLPSLSPLSVLPSLSPLVLSAATPAPDKTLVASLLPSLSPLSVLLTAPASSVLSTASLQSAAAAKKKENQRIQQAVTAGC